MNEKEVSFIEVIERIKGLEVIINNGIKIDLIDIKKQIYNCLPIKIDNLENSVYQAKLSNSKWLIGILVSLIFLLGSTIINLIK